MLRGNHMTDSFDCTSPSLTNVNVSISSDRIIMNHIPRAQMKFTWEDSICAALKDCRHNCGTALQNENTWCTPAQMWKVSNWKKKELGYLFKSFFNSMFHHKVEKQSHLLRDSSGHSVHFIHYITHYTLQYLWIELRRTQGVRESAGIFFLHFKWDLSHLLYYVNDLYAFNMMNCELLLDSENICSVFQMVKLMFVESGSHLHSCM